MATATATPTKLRSGAQRRTQEMSNADKERIKHLEGRIVGLVNDAKYWDLRRTYGDYSSEVLSHLEGCARYRGADDSANT